MSGKGTRFILANTEQLHAKIQEMSDRIRHLEEAVQKTEPDSPLLAPELLAVKSTMGLYSSNGGSSANAQDKDDGKKTNGATPSDGQKDTGASRDESASTDDTMQVDGPSCIVKTVRHPSHSNVHPFLTARVVDPGELNHIRSHLYTIGYPPHQLFIPPP